MLTVARLDSAEGYKGYDRIVEALPAVREACGPVRFVIAGSGNDRARVEALGSTPSPLESASESRPYCLRASPDRPEEA